ncbi:MAG: fumarylacetoacetate hydrolase family protein, partial [Sphingomonas fennica]
MGRKVPDFDGTDRPNIARIPRRRSSATNATVDWPAYIKRIGLRARAGLGDRPAMRPTSRPRNSLDTLFGVTLYNDFSGRDLQADELPIGMGSTKAKNFAHAIGPWITTIDEFDDLYSIPMEVRLNGEVKGKGHSGGELWKVAEVLAFISLGRISATGRRHRIGHDGRRGSALELDLHLKPGRCRRTGSRRGSARCAIPFGQPIEGLWLADAADRQALVKGGLRHGARR